MKTIFMLVFLTTCAASVFGMIPQPPVQAIALEGKLNYPFISERGGIAFLQLTVTTANIGVQSDRKPMNLAIVLDRSGSMGDERKMEYVKQAFHSLVDQLRPSDILSVVIYDDVIDVIRRAHRVGNEKSEINRLIDEVYPRGSTNLGGGLMEGLHQAERYASSGYINRVVLLSDGLANVGVTDPTELNRNAKRYRNYSISITTMGVGLDYNENLMMGLAESGGGNYYFIERPTSLASIVRKEMNVLSSVLAQNGTININLGRNVRVNDIIGCDYRGDNGSYVIPVGDLCANERREFTVELVVPEGTGAMNVANGELRYESSVISREYPTFSAAVKYTKDFVEIERNRDKDVQAKADIAVSTRQVDKAMKAMDAGDHAAAEQHLQKAQSIISASPAVSAAGASGTALRQQLGKMESYQKELKDSSGDLRRAKKSIQYQNYQTQKNK
ncbi:MAG: VWA domain-containing protein [Bacteroidota bacterium]|nr:VWA domain-containing protein [Bacteroidota bacterium]